MTWKIHAINNETGKVTISDEKDKRSSLVIPQEHRTAEEKNAYIKGHLNQYDKHSKVLKLIYILAAFSVLEFFAILGLFLEYK